MEWTAEHLPDGIEKVILAGRMDSEGTRQIDVHFTALTASRAELIVVDMAQVPFLASIGLRTLLSNAKALALRGGRMVLARPQPMVADVLSLAGIDALIPVHPDLERACAALKTPMESL